MIDAERKRKLVHFFLVELKRLAGSGIYDITMPEEIREHELLYRLAIEILKTEPLPPYTPPKSGYGMSVVYSNNEQTREMKTGNELYPLFCDTIWQLCLRGLLRPGTSIGQQHYGQPIKQYALTLRGREWVKNFTEDDVKGLVESL